MGKIAFFSRARTAAVFFKYFVLNVYFRAYITVTPYTHYKKKLVPVHGPDASGHLARWIGHYTYLTSRYVIGATCLSRALTARWILARKGYSAVIRVGVAKDAGAIKAHAWITSGDLIVTGNENGEVQQYGQMIINVKTPDQ